MSEPRQIRVYIAGPMTGRQHYNLREFTAAQIAWNDAGYEAETPFDANSRVWQKHHGRDFDPRKDVCDWGDPILPEMVAEDFGVLCRADIVALLPGWEKSKGSRAEILIACNLGKEIRDAITFEPIPLTASAIVARTDESAVQEAHRLVHGDRGADYGHPIEDYTRTGRIWGAILGLPDIDPRLCALMMAGLKIGREVHKPKRDNRVDLAGYAECAEMIAARQSEAA